MKAVELVGYNGLDSLRIIEIDRPNPRDHEVVIEVKAAGINFADLELTKGRYSIGKEPPFVMGFEAAGIVVEVGAKAQGVRVGDKVTSIVSSGGYAEYALADAASVIPIPNGITFGQAVTIPIQGSSAYALLAHAARLRSGDSVLVQSAAGGVGAYLVQLARLLGAGQVIALAGSEKKLKFLHDLGVEVAVNSGRSDWVDAVRKVVGDRGIDIVLQAATGDLGRRSFELAAPFGRIVVFGARNANDSLAPDQMRQLILKNQSLIGFNLPTVGIGPIIQAREALVPLVASGRVKTFAESSFPLANVAEAHRTISDRGTVGKVVLVP